MVRVRTTATTSSVGPCAGANSSDLLAQTCHDFGIDSKSATGWSQLHSRKPWSNEIPAIQCTIPKGLLFRGTGVIIIIAAKTAALHERSPFSGMLLCLAHCVPHAVISFESAWNFRTRPWMSIHCCNSINCSWCWRATTDLPKLQLSFIWIHQQFFFGERQIIVSYLLKKRLDQLMLLKSWLSQKPVLRWKKKTFVKSWLQGTGIQIDRGNCSAFSLLNFSPLLQNPFRFLSFFWCQSQGQAVGFTNKGAKERMLDYQQSKNAHRCQTIASSSEEPETKIDGCRSSREKATVIIIAHQFPCQVTFVLLSATQSVHKQKSDVDSTAAKIKLNFQMAELIY